MPPECSEARTLSLATMGALIGDPVRAAILLHLSDGSRRPASELAYLAGASPQAASAHLAQLVEGGLIVGERMGRHRFFRLSSGEIAEMLEGLANWGDPHPRCRQSDPALCRARLCYDHLAGRLGVDMFDGMVARGWLILGSDGPGLNPAGLEWCRKNSLDLNPPAKSRRPLLRLCLDWTERRHHLGGRFGAVLARALFDAGYLRRRSGERIVDVTPPGAAFFRRELSIDIPN